jgi:cytochrome c oxidase assembly factor CtaG
VADVLQALLVWASCALLLVVYRQASSRHPGALGRGRRRAFAVGLVALGVALGPPLDAAAERLLWAHMLQHLLLITVAAPLIALGVPAWLAVTALPARGLRRAAQRTLSSRRLPGTAGVLLAMHTVVVWLWHVPAAFELALRSTPIHLAEHACFLGTAVVAWWPIADGRLRARLGGGGALAYAIGMSAQGAVLGALMTFAATPWYPAYAGTERAAGIAPLVDQQAAGLSMWIPASAITFGVIAVLLFSWLSDHDVVEPGEARVVGGYEGFR